MTKPHTSNWIATLICIFLICCSTWVRADAVILAYHHVDTTTPASTTVSPELFAQHLQYLQEQAFTVVPLQDITSAIRHGQAVGQRQVAITFDDAYVSVFTQAWPLLEAAGLPFTVFVHPSAIGDEPGLHMSWAQLRQLHDEGVEIGNHSNNHAHLANLSVAEAMADVEQAQQLLKARLGQSPANLAYPYGEFTPALAQAVLDAGLVGLGQHSGAVNEHSHPGWLPRFPMSGRYAEMSSFAQRVQSIAMLVQASPLPGLITTIDQPSVTLTFPQVPRGLSCYATAQGAMQLTQVEKSVVITPVEAIKPGRTKYNCTAPTQTPGVYQWWSYLLLRPLASGAWYNW